MKELKFITLAMLAAIYAAACSSSSSSGRLSDADIAAARSIFTTQGCVACHGPDGSGGVGANLRSGPYAEHPIQRYRDQITNGGNGMPPFKDKLKPEQIDLMARFVKQEFQGK